jgi:hypothetical protein
MLYERLGFIHTLIKPYLLTQIRLYVICKFDGRRKGEEKTYLNPFTIADIKYKFSGKGISVKSANRSGTLSV